MKKKVWTFLFLLPVVLSAVVFASCGGRSGSGEVQNDSVEFRYARLIHVYRHDGWLLALVDNPWKKGEVLHRYVIVPKTGKVPRDISGATVVRTPLQRSVVFTSVHCGLLDALGKLDAVKGICDFRYVMSGKVKKYVENGGARDVGSSVQPDIEKIIAENPDGVLVSPFSGGGGYDKLKIAGLPLIECADYMEKSPLARAEWMRFYGLLYGCESVADSLFAVVEGNYKDLCGKAAITSSRPSLMCDLLQGNVWYVPGGESTVGRIFKDAGANYLFGDNSESGSIAMSPEQVLTKARNADFWVVRSGSNDDLTYDGLRKENAMYAAFKSWKEKKIFACNTFKLPYFDEEPFRPDFMLRDLVMILHPELGISQPPRYFSPIK